MREYFGPAPHKHEKKSLGASMKKQKRLSPTDTLDRLLFRPIFGIPFFFAVLSLVVFLSFYGIGGRLADVLETILFQIGESSARKFLQLGVSAFAVHYLIDGIYAAIASAIAFLPQTLIFFLLVRVLDECAYLPRAILATDRFFRRFGLSGNAVIPLMLGCGCGASSVSVCPGHPDQNAVIRALPFVPCNARLPVILFLADSFFPTRKTFAVILIFALSFVLITLSLLFSAQSKSGDSPLITELPNFRLPRLRILKKEVKERSIEYLERAGTAVFFSSAVFSLLAMLTPSLHPTEHISQSILYAGAVKAVAIFRPLGFDRPEAAAALFFGFFAKENIISVLGIMAQDDLYTLITPHAAIAFTAFCAFYTPCVFLLSAEAKRSGISKAMILFFRTFAVAYLLSFILSIGSHIFLNNC